MLSVKGTLLYVSAFAGCTAIAAVWLGMAEEQPRAEAPAGFNTPSFNSAASVSNGIPEPVTGDSFALDQQLFERNHQENSPDHTQTGLGPVYNATACVSCHENPNTGGQSQITELRVGHNDATGMFVNPTIIINDGQDMITGRSIVNDRAICPQAQEHIPDTENIRALRAVLNTLGDGFVEAIDDQTLVEIAADQAQKTNGKIHGEVVQAPIFEAPGQTPQTPVTRVGRFGWKDQHGSLLSFVADAYLNEMGVTSSLRPHTVTTVCQTTTDPEDARDALGMEDIDHFAQFIRGTMVPPRDTTLAMTDSAGRGEHLFAELGCRICHVDKIVTAKVGSVFNGGKFIVPDALGNKVIHPFGDFLLHDVGTGDGIVQVGPQDTANKLRTAPLWGLRTHSRYMHDLKSLTLEDAIARHKGEAAEASGRFEELGGGDRQDLLNFLNSL
ncbi:MAG TPA: di-heme oxidoredictase family protein [Terracidiphilus sp.]|nr:di-heme oxidoredictase family protein [Terracidiphilus sp.]